MDENSAGFKFFVGIFTLYMGTVTLACAYYNWQYAHEIGFVKWLLLGEVVPTAKSLVWPYFAFRSDTSPPRNAAGHVKGLTQRQIVSMELNHMADALNASQQATYLINTGSGQQGQGIKSYSNIDKIVGYRRTALEIARKVNYEVLDGVYPELGTRFRNDFLSYLVTFLQAYEANSDDLLKQADAMSDRWADWYQTNQKGLQAGADKALGY
jgi:hypothetical protein